jgi:hypothetical protein
MTYVMVGTGDLATFETVYVTYDGEGFNPVMTVCIPAKSMFSKDVLKGGLAHARELAMDSGSGMNQTVIYLQRPAAPFVEVKRQDDASCPRNTWSNGKVTEVHAVEGFKGPQGAEDVFVFCQSEVPNTKPEVWCSTALAQGNMYCQISAWAPEQGRALELLNLILAPAAQRLRQIPA